MAGPILVDRRGVPRYWATIWSNILKAQLAEGTRLRSLARVDQLYLAAEQQCESLRLDDVISNRDFGALEAILSGFLAQLRNSASINNVDLGPTWLSALGFVKDMVAHGGPSAAARMAEIDTRLQRLNHMYADLRPNRAKPPAPIRALPAIVVEDLYAVFHPSSPRNPFRSEKQRWRNLLVFVLLLRLGLRRGEAALLQSNSLKDEMDPDNLRQLWLDVTTTDDHDPRYEKPGLKTEYSKRQIPVPSDVQTLFDLYASNFRGRSAYPHLLVSLKRRPLSLRMISEIFETATTHLSENALTSLRNQGLTGVSCHDLRHTCVVARMRRYRDGGDDLDTAIEKCRAYFGWSLDSQMPRLYAKAYFETTLAEILGESFDQFVAAVRDLARS